MRKKPLITLFILTVVLVAITSCGKKEDEAISTNNSTANQTTDDSSDSAFSNIGENANVSLEGIEVYDDVQGATIDFSIEDFKLENIENFDDADMAKIDNFTETQLLEIQTTKANLLNKLMIAFKSVDIDVNINETSGEISLDSSVLFGGDSAVLSSKGKAFLKKFITTYTSVIFSDEFDGFVSTILVEGHTAPLAGSTYESGFPLSQERADNVKKYCLSKETGISQNHITELSKVLEAKGLSNSKPIKDASGNVDKDASRRVSFRFLINLD